MGKTHGYQMLELHPDYGHCADNTGPPPEVGHRAIDCDVREL